MSETPREVQIRKAALQQKVDQATGADIARLREAADKPREIKGQNHLEFLRAKAGQQRLVEANPPPVRKRPDYVLDPEPPATAERQSIIKRIMDGESGAENDLREHDIRNGHRQAT